MDVARSETVEKQLDAMISRRDEKRRKKSEGEQAEEVLWAESERRHFARQRQENRWEWVRYFDRLAASLRARAEEYDRRAEALIETGHHGEEK